MAWVSFPGQPVLIYKVLAWKISTLLGCVCVCVRVRLCVCACVCVCVCVWCQLEHVGFLPQGILLFFLLTSSRCFCKPGGRALIAQALTWRVVPMATLCKAPCTGRANAHGPFEAPVCVSQPSWTVLPSASTPEDLGTHLGGRAGVGSSLSSSLCHAVHPAVLVAWWKVTRVLVSRHGLPCPSMGGSH